MNLTKPLSRPLRSVREIENLWITLSDGCRLAARLWLPEDAEQAPVPAILEYLPYRKRDQTAPRDESMHPYMAARGYACIRVDMRGNGESDGLMLDEYLPQEQEDGVEVIDWIAAQPWCSGTVGMMGISWGGFNGLQIAALRPPALKAIVTICSTDDRYADDIHYKGGCLLNDNLGWGATMLAYSSRPPDPLLAGEGWRETWLQRLENMPFLAANWLEHQHRDDFWRQGSVCEDFGAIQAAVFAVGGWADPYSNAVPRLLAGLEAPAIGLVGPWGHKYPHLGVPGPAMPFLDEMLRWWDHWLKGIDTGIMDEPAYRAYRLDGPDTGSGPDRRAGAWIAEPRWPSSNIGTQVLSLGPRGTLTDAPGPEQALTLRSPETTGLAAGRFYPRLGRPDLPCDQREDDAGSLIFDGDPLSDPLTIFGAPALELDLAIDRPQGNLAVRLCDVAPDGSSHRISFGLLNLAHREGHATPQPLEPGARYRVRLQLDDIAYRIAPGHRLRIAVSTTYWPMIWPAPEPVTLTLFAGSRRLLLPVRPERNEAPIAFPEPGDAPPPDIDMLVPATAERKIEKDRVSGEVSVSFVDDSGTKRFRSHGLETRTIGRERYGIRPEDPLSAWAETHWTCEIGRGDWRVRTESRTAMRADRTTFHLEGELEAYEGERRIYTHRWTRSIPRDSM